MSARILSRLSIHDKQEGEFVAQFVAELRRLSEHYELNDSLEAMLRGRVVCEVNEIRLQ